MILNTVLCLMLLVVDQITKALAVSFLKPSGSITVIDKILDFTYVENTGIAFGMLKGMHYIVLPITIVISALCILFAVKAYQKDYKKLSLALMVITSGAIGNMIDKILNGFVIDFIELKFISFPVFNFADICVTLGAALFAVIILFTKDGDFFADKK